MKTRKPVSNGSLKTRIAESRNRLFRVALAWCGDEMLADDLVQETMTDGITKSHQLRDEGRLFPWLYSILHNNWNQYLRRRKPQVEVDDNLPGSDDGPLGACEELEIVTRVRRAIMTLPLDQRQVISLVDLEEFSYCDVAQVLNIPIGTVMSRLHRARKTLLERLDKAAAGVSREHIRIVK